MNDNARVGGQVALVNGLWAAPEVPHVVDLDSVEWHDVWPAVGTCGRHPIATWRSHEPGLHGGPRQRLRGFLVVLREPEHLRHRFGLLIGSR